MRIEANNNPVFFEHNFQKIEIYLIWFREITNGEKYLEKLNKQRLINPTSLKSITIESVIINKDTLKKISVVVLNHNMQLQH
tara:strand:+ start:303 stop:548 length:246 start_codon:yes stop_codon:yes gene_type:complete